MNVKYHVHRHSIFYRRRNFIRSDREVLLPLSVTTGQEVSTNTCFPIDKGGDLRNPKRI